MYSHYGLTQNNAIIH